MVDALTHAVGDAEPHEPGSLRPRVRRMMKRMASLLDDALRTPLDYHVILLGSLDRKPVPQIIARETFGPTFSLIEPRDEMKVQRLLDECGPMCELSVPAALAELREPRTFIYSKDAPREWFDGVFRSNLLDPNFWQDCMAGYWAGSKDRVIIYNAFQPIGAAHFVDKHRPVLSLMTRAVAPVMDELFYEPDTPLPTGIDPSLYPVLMMVLQGYSDREIAEIAGVMSDQVHLAVDALKREIGVETRGQLIAEFVDRRVLSWLEQQAE